jgi:hypothetical protein
MKRILILEKKNLFFISEFPDVLDFEEFHSESKKILGVIRYNNIIENDNDKIISLTKVSHMTDLIFKNNKIFGEIKILETPEGIFLKNFINHNFDFNFHLNYIKEVSRIVSVDIKINET